MLLLGGNPDAIILDCINDLAVGNVGVDSNSPRAIRGKIFDRIIEKIGEDLNQLRFIAYTGRQGSDFDLDPLFIDLVPDALDDMVDHLVHIDSSELQGAAT